METQIKWLNGRRSKKKVESIRINFFLRTFAFCGTGNCGRRLEEDGDWGWIFIQMGDISPCLQVDGNDPTIGIKGIFSVSFVLQQIWNGMNVHLDKRNYNLQIEKHQLPTKSKTKILIMLLSIAYLCKQERGSLFLTRMWAWYHMEVFYGITVCCLWRKRQMDLLLLNEKDHFILI